MFLLTSSKFDPHHITSPPTTPRMRAAQPRNMDVPNTHTCGLSPICADWKLFIAKAVAICFENNKIKITLFLKLCRKSFRKLLKYEHTLKAYRSYNNIFILLSIHKTGLK